MAGAGDLYQIVNTGGVVGLLCVAIFVILVGLYRGWWVPGPFYQDMKARVEKLEETNRGYEEHFETIIALLKADPPPPPRGRTPR